MGDDIQFVPPRPVLEADGSFFRIDDLFDDGTASVSYFSRKEDKYQYVLVPLTEIRRAIYPPKEDALYMRCTVGDDRGKIICVLPDVKSFTTEELFDGILRAVYAYEMGYDNGPGPSREEAELFVTLTGAQPFHEAYRVGKRKGPYVDSDVYWQVI